MNAEPSHYRFRPHDGLVDLVFVDKDGTTETLADSVDLQTALAITTDHAQTREEEEP